MGVGEPRVDRGDELGENVGPVVGAGAAVAQPQDGRAGTQPFDADGGQNGTRGRWIKLRNSGDGVVRGVVD